MAKNPKIKDNYLKYLGISVEDVQKTSGKPGVGRNIYLYLSDNPIAGSKLDLFHAFYTMGRISFVPSISVCVMSILCEFGPTSASNNKIIVPSISTIVAYLMYHRNKRFYKLTYERAYKVFLKCSNS